VDDALVASLETGIDEIDAPGGAGKTVRVSGEVKTSPRPKARPDLTVVPDEQAIAMAEGIDGALAEATAEPAPEGTLEFQAEVMAGAEPPAATASPEEAAAVETALAEVAVEPEAAPTLVEETVVAAAEPGSLEAQAAALDEAPTETLVAEVAPEPVVDPALAALKPKARPETLVAPQVAEAAPVAEAPAALVTEEVVVAEVAPVVEEIVVAEAELVVTDPGTEVAADTPLLPMPEVTEVESVAGATAIAPPATDLALAAAAMPKRQAPIFDAVEPAEAAANEEEVVVVMSTSGGRHFGVNVGEYPSRYEAEKALLKTALAESATLNEGLRKTSQSGGKWRASFMGLTEEQAELACRRLSARAVPCETVGG
jgi:D-alanyl-D-alanine carboxypeptidase